MESLLARLEKCFCRVEKGGEACRGIADWQVADVVFLAPSFEGGGGVEGRKEGRALVSVISLNLVVEGGEESGRKTYAEER